MKFVSIFLITLISILLILFSYTYSDDLLDSKYLNPNKLLNINNDENSGLIPIPLILYTPETHVVFSGIAIYYFKFKEPIYSTINRHTSYLKPLLVYTSKKQFVASLDSEIYFNSDNFLFSCSLMYNNRPDKFYGVGNNTSKFNEEEYTRRFFEATLRLQKRIVSNFFCGIQYYYGFSNLVEHIDDGLLFTNGYSGLGKTVTAGAGPIFSWDTRDNAFSTNSGSYFQLFTFIHDRAIDSDDNFCVYKLDLRHFITIFDNHVLAFQSYFRFVSGKPPFFEYSQMGGANLMRGIYPGRYRDNDMIVFQTEYRFPLVWIMDLAAFTSIGKVTNKLENIDNEKYRWTAGLGLRFTLDKKERIKFRFDCSYFENSFHPYLMVLEAF